MHSRLLAPFLFVLSILTLFHEPSCCASEPTDVSSESLLSLPYMQYVETEKAPNKTGTTINKKDKAFQGYSIYTSNNDTNAFVHLIDMDGKLIHSWARNAQNGSLRWHHVIPFPDGSLLTTSQWTDLDWQRIDANSYCFATYDMPGQRAHHALYLLKNGDFLGLTQNTTTVPFKDTALKIEDNSLVHISSKGKPLKIISLSALLKKDLGYQRNLQKAYNKETKHQPKSSKRKIKQPSFEPIHANNIENLEWDIPGIAKKGDWLITIRNLDRVLIVDPEKEEIVWQWGENIIDMPHHATFLQGDKILLLDNGAHQKSSRVIELDLRSKRIIWQYGRKPGQEFFTGTGGSAQRLPNGNTLIAETNSGHVFEVTAAGEIVWEWYAEYRTEGRHKGKRKTVYRMMRLPYDFFKNVKFNYGKTTP